jgi:hypothetical protein
MREIEMPYQIKQVSPSKFSVSNKDTGKVHAHHTTKAKAEAQVRLLHAIENGTLKRRKN